MCDADGASAVRSTSVWAPSTSLRCGRLALTTDKPGRRSDKESPVLSSCRIALGGTLSGSASDRHLFFFFLYNLCFYLILIFTLIKIAFCYMEKFKVPFLRTLQQTILILVYSSLTLTMDAASFSETSVYIYQCTRRHIPECILTRKL